MASAEEIVQVFTGLRYFSAFSFIAVLYDIVITIDDEVNTIWNNPNTRWHSKVVFVANRYLTVAILAFVSYLFNGTATTLNNTVCRQFFWIYGSALIVVSWTSHFVILIRVYRLWDRRGSVARTLTAMFTVFISTTIILGVFAAMQLQSEYFEPLRTCLFLTKPVFLVALLGVASAFDLILVLFIVFNAMDRPRLIDVPLVSELQKDGAGIFLVIFALRLASFIVSIFLDMSKIFLALTTVGALYTIINARLHMRLEGLSLNRVPANGHLIMLESM